MNPRETRLQHLMDDFATDQSGSFDIISSIPQTTQTTAEMDYLKNMVQKLTKYYNEYRSCKNELMTKTQQSAREITREELNQCYENVPELFFRSSYTLQNSDIFNTIYTQLQDKLPSYLDLVEVALLKLIWSRSTSFFRAMDDIKGLQRKVTDAISQIIALRRTLRTVDNNVAVLSMKIPRLNRRRQNLNVVSHILSSMQSVIQVQYAADYFS